MCLGEVVLSGDGEFEGFMVYRISILLKHDMFDCGCQSASGANARFEIMMRRWRVLVENGVGDVSFAL